MIFKIPLKIMKKDEKAVRVWLINSGRYRFVNLSNGSKKVVYFNGKKFELHLDENGVVFIKEKGIRPGTYSMWKKERNDIIRKIKSNLVEATFLGESLRKHEISRYLNLEDEDLPEWYRLARMIHFKNIKELRSKLQFLNAKKPAMVSLRVRIPTNRTKIEAHGMLISAFVL